MTGVDLNDYTTAIARLAGKGFRCGTMIDVGCADGHLFLQMKLRGLMPDAVPLNLDANDLYEPSLKAIKDVVGGDYRITAVADTIGEIEFTRSAHPYWSSLRGEGDPYWKRINDLVDTKVKVPVTTLDVLAKELALKPPFLLKLDVQGAEQSVLAGATAVLADTQVIVCEADIADFDAINTAIVAAGFFLYDLTMLSRIQDGTLAWFYPVYLNNSCKSWAPSAFWDAAQNDALIKTQAMRREGILKANTDMLNRLKFRNSAVGRNDPCPCGSGKRFKHCCGQHG